MEDKVNTPASYELMECGFGYESYRDMERHEGRAFDTHGDWVDYETMVEELHGAALWIASLKSSHAELLEALKRIYGTLSFYEDSEEKLEGIKNRVVLINAEGPEGDFQDMLRWAKEVITRAEEKS